MDERVGRRGRGRGRGRRAARAAVLGLGRTMQTVYDKPPEDPFAAIEVDDANRRAPSDPVDLVLDPDDPAASTAVVRRSTE